jgi:CRP-like cAMP-binding protein
MLNETELQQLSTSMVKHVFKPGHNIVRQGENGDSMFILFEGLLDVILSDADSEVIVASIAPLNYFGEMSLLTGEVRSATIRCVTEAVVYEIRHADFTELISRREAIIDQIALNIAKRRTRNGEVMEKEKEKSTLIPSEDFITLLVRRIKHFFSVTA